VIARRSGSVVVAELPMTPTGKISKADLALRLVGAGAAAKAAT
jgi:hypothetical protein